MANKPVNIVLKADYNDKDLKRVIGDLQKLQQQGGGLGTKFQNVGSQMQAFGRSVGHVGASLTKSVTLPIVGLGAAAVKSFADFDAAMTQSLAIMGDVSEEQSQRMQKAARDVATSLNISHKEAAESFYFLASAGLDAEQSIAALPRVAAFAKAGMFDMAQATDLATDAQSALGLTVDDSQQNLTNLTRVTDVFVKANQLANASVEEFSKSITNKAGSALRLANKDLEEGVGVLALFADAGIKGEKAGTLLARTLQGLQDNARKNTDEFDKFGIQVYNADGSMRSMVEISKDLTDSLGGMSVKERDAAIAKMGFNKLAKEGIGYLIGNVEKLEEYTDGVYAAGGAVDEVAQKQLETFNEKLGLLGKQFTDIAIEFGPIIIDQFLVPLGQKLQEIAQFFAELTPRQREQIVMFAGIAAAIGPVLMVVGKLIMAMGAVVKVVGLIIAAFNPVTLAIVGIVAAIAGLVAAFMVVWNRSETLRKAVGDLMATLQNIARVIIGDVMAAFKRIIGGGTDLRAIFERVADVAGKVLTIAVEKLKGALEFLGNVVRAGIKIFEIQVKLFRVIAQTIIGVVVAAIDIWMNRLGPISAAVRYFVNGAVIGFKAIGSIVASVFRNAGTYIENFINSAIRAINALISAYNMLAGVLPGMSRITQLTEFRFKSMSVSASGAASSANNLANQVGGYASQVLRGNKAVEAGTSSLNAFGDSASGAADDVDDLAGLLGGDGDGDKGGKGKKSVAGGAKKAAEALKKYDEVFKKHVDRLKAATAEIKAAYDGMAKSVQDAVMGALDFSSAAPEIGEDGQRVGKTFIEKLTEQANRAKEFAEKVRQLVQAGLSPEAMQRVLAAGADAGGRIADELIAGGSEAIETTNNLVASTQTAAETIGIEAAESFYGAGLRMAMQVEEAFIKRFGKGGPAYGKIKPLLKYLARVFGESGDESGTALTQRSAAAITNNSGPESGVVTAARSMGRNVGKAAEQSMASAGTNAAMTFVTGLEGTLKPGTKEHDAFMLAVMNMIRVIEAPLLQVFKDAALNFARSFIKTIVDYVLPETPGFVILDEAMIAMMEKFDELNKARFGDSGLLMGKTFMEKLKEELSPAGSIYAALQAEATALAGSLARTVTYTVQLVFGGWAEGSSPPSGASVVGQPTIVGATGGIVNRPTFALIGEAGPEAVIPLSRSRGNEPLPFGGRLGGGSSASINVTINAGMGTDGAEVGRQVVEAIKKYERRSGKVFAAA
jgi:TP901 family phage tail tape measure protein